MTDLRTRKKLAAMHRVQDVAVALFEKRGFDSVAIEEIAAAADVSPASIYRYFETKPGIVFWDEYDPLLVEALSSRPIAKMDDVRSAIQEGLADVYDRAGADLLRRTSMIYREPSLLASLPVRMDGLAQWIASLLSGGEPDLATLVMARGAVGALRSAIEAWVAGRGKLPLSGLIDEAFGALRE